MAQQIKKKYIQDGAVDGEKVKLLKDQSIKGEDQSGQEVELLKLGQEDEVLVKGEEVGLKSQIDAEKTRAEGEESRIEGLVTAETANRIAGDMAEKVRAEGEEGRIEGKVDQEILDRIAGDQGIQNDLDVEKGKVSTLQGEMSQAQSDISDNSSAISTEVSDRQGEITRVEGLISTEVSDRQSEISRVEGLITAEELARTMADSGLSSEISTERSRIDSILEMADMDKDSFKEIADLISSVDMENDNALLEAVNSINSSIQSEEQARIDADNLLSQAISSEESARQTQDGILQGNIDTVSGNLATEVSDRESGDNAIKGNLDDALYSTIEQLDDALAAEVSARSSADTTLQGNIDTVSNNFDSFLSGDFATEQGHIDTLQSDLAQEISNRQSGDAALQTTIDAIQGLDDILFEDSGVNSSGNATVDPEGRDGWYYKNAGSGEKAFWYFFSSVDGEGNVVNPVTVEEFQGVYSVNSVEAGPEGDTFHMALYTTPQGDGNDASWYRSRRVYVPSEPFDREVKMLFYVGQEPDASVHPELPRMEMVESVVAGQQAGDFANSESMLYVAFSTNSVSQAGSIELLVNALGFNSSVYNKEYSLQIRDNFSLSGIKDSVLSNQSQIEQNTAAIEALDGNFATDQELAAEATLRENADTELQGKIDTEKGRIDAILSASEADKDSFAEIVTLINTIDSENDEAFAGHVMNYNSYVSSNDSRVGTLEGEMDSVEFRATSLEGDMSQAQSDILANSSAINGEISDRQSEISRVEGLISTEQTRAEEEESRIEGKVTSLENIVQSLFSKESKTVDSQMLSDGHFFLAAEAIPSSLVMFVDRLALHEGSGLDYTISVEGGLTKVTFESQMLEPSEEALEDGQVLRITYAKYQA